MDMTQFGGTPVSPYKSADVAGVVDWNFGYIMPHQRGKEQDDFHAAEVAAMPRFAITGSGTSEANKVALWECSKVANGGRHFLVFRQVKGSCVGNGGGQITWYLSAVEVVRLKDPEQVLLPWWFNAYAKSREYAGLRGKGDGSFGSAFAKAARLDGFWRADDPELPQPNTDNGICWGGDVEWEWSDGPTIPKKWLEKSRTRLVKTTAPIKSADEGRESVRNYYGYTIASDWGGLMQCPTEGGVLLNRRSGVWQHQMCVIGWQDHPTLGELFCVLNSWGPGAHGAPPDDAPPGSFWIKKADMDYICRNGEAFAFSQFDGFPAQRVEWIF